MSFVNLKIERLRSIVSQLATVNGFSIHSIGNSEFIRELLNAKDLQSSSSLVHYT